jgi:hypothetical protein
MDQLKFCAIGFFNEAGTLKSSSLLIFLFKAQSIYTQKMWQKVILIKNCDKSNAKLK